MTNLEFHVFIATISGNHRLAHLLRHVLQDLSRSFVLDWNVGRKDAEPMVKSHVEIVKALRKRDVSRPKAVNERTRQPRIN
jgi:DNA-binding GntR family transcriptional regulator